MYRDADAPDKTNHIPPRSVLIHELDVRGMRVVVGGFAVHIENRLRGEIDDMGEAPTTKHGEHQV